LSYAALEIRAKGMGLKGVYEGESVNRSQLDIKCKTCDIQTRKNIYFSKYPPPTFIHLSHRFNRVLKPAA
jgi:hypothetical protein